MTAVEHRLADAAHVNLLTFWNGRAEGADVVARKTAATVQGLASVCPVDGWRYPDGNAWGAWPATAHEQADWVESKVFRSEDGDPSPVNGYSFSLSQEIAGLDIDLGINAGSTVEGGRVPANRVRVTLRETTPRGFTTAVVDPIVEAVVDVWEPLAGNFRDRAVLKLARPTSSWQVPIGHRIWVDDSVASIHQVAPGVITSRRGTGTLLSAPDEWTTHRVVEAMRQTLSMNGIDEVSH